MMRIIGVLHALRLYHIDLFRKMPTEKSIIYIKMANFPLAIECNAKHSTDGDEIYHMTQIIVKFNAWMLVKGFNNKASCETSRKS